MPPRCRLAAPDSTSQAVRPHRREPAPLPEHGLSLQHRFCWQRHRLRWGVDLGLGALVFCLQLLEPLRHPVTGKPTEMVGSLLLRVCVLEREASEAKGGTTALVSAICVIQQSDASPSDSGSGKLNATIGLLCHWIKIGVIAAFDTKTAMHSNLLQCNVQTKTRTRSTQTQRPLSLHLALYQMHWSRCHYLAHLCQLHPLLPGRKWWGGASTTPDPSQPLVFNNADAARAHSPMQTLEDLPIALLHAGRQVPSAPRPSGRRRQVYPGPDWCRAALAT
jgi:hypothetical protein